MVKISTSNVMPARPPVAAALYVAIIQVTLTRRLVHHSVTGLQCC